MHRNTVLLIIVLGVLAAVVVGVNIGNKLHPTKQTGSTASGAPSPTPPPTLYDDTACGFSVMYGPDFTLQENASGGAVLNKGNDQSQSIVMACQKDIPRPALPLNQTEKLYFPDENGASVAAMLYHDTGAKNGTPVDAVIFTHPTRKTDIFISGTGPLFEAVVKTVRILP